MLWSYWTFPFKSTGGVTRDHFHQFDISTTAKIWRDTSEIFDIESKVLSFSGLTAILGPVWCSGGSTNGRVTRDPCQISISTGGCVTRDCRFERNTTVVSHRQTPQQFWCLCLACCTRDYISKRRNLVSDQVWVQNLIPIFQFSTNQCWIGG